MGLSAHRQWSQAWITLIGTGADGKVRAISEAPASILTRGYPYLAATVRRFMRLSGSDSVFAVGDAGDIGSKPVHDALAAGILRDALPDAGRTLHQQGVHTGGKGFSLTQGRRVAEGGPAPTSPSAAAMEIQRDGTLMVRGDPTQLQERLRQGGVVVGLDQVDKARQLLGGLQPAQPHNPALSQGKLVAESYRGGYSDADGRVQEPTQPDDGRGPTTGRSSASTTDSVRGAGDAIPPRTATLVGLGIAKRIELAGSQALVGERVDSPEQLCLPAVQRLRPMVCRLPALLTPPHAATPAPAP